MANTNTYQAQANELSQKLWAIANELRGQMDASEFKNYILGVIFYRYLSERTEMYMAEILENDGVTYEEAFADDDYRSVVEEWSLTKLGYVIRPENLFRNLIRKITKFESEADRFSVEDFEKAINDLVGSTMGHESNKAFDGLFNDIDKIVDAYEKRAEIDKFAHKAYMSEIIENGYNLNIPRYVDTFEEEEPVDLDAVRNRIKTLDSETKAAIDKAESFMRELGL